MDVKEFDRNKNQLNIDALTSQDIAQMNDDMETEDDITTDPRQLYKKFEDMWTKEKGGQWTNWLSLLTYIRIWNIFTLIHYR